MTEMYTKSKPSVSSLSLCVCVDASTSTESTQAPVLGPGGRHACGAVAYAPYRFFPLTSVDSTSASVVSLGRFRSSASSSESAVSLNLA